MTKTEIAAGLRLSGSVLLAVHDADGRLVQQVEEDNVVCNAGMTPLTAAINWSGIADQATTGTQAYLWPIWGAVGTGQTAASAGDTQLGIEYTRGAVTAGTGSGQQVIWTFFLGINTGGSVSIWEAGVFVSGNGVGATGVANTGNLLNHLVYGAAVIWGTNQTLTMQSTFTYTPT